MNSYTKSQYKKYLVKYLDHEYGIQVKEKNKFNCPICKKEESAIIYPNNPTKFYCLCPDCNFKGDVFDLFRKTKSDKLTDKSIAKLLNKKMNIEIQDETNKIFEMYQKNNFSIFPIAKGTKIPTIKEWQKSNYKNPNDWTQWLDQNQDIGINIGTSGVCIVDIDDKKTYDKLNHLFGETLMQETQRGWHLVYKEDKDFFKTLNKVLRDDGHEAELRVAGAYCVVAPSSVNGEIRKWNYKEVAEMPKEFKEFFMKYYKDEVKEEKQDHIEKNIQNNKISKISLEGLDGCYNDFFVSYGGILRKKCNSETVQYALYNLNQAFEKPMSNKDLRSMFSQIEKYDRGDQKDLEKKILEHLRVIDEGSSFEISTSLRYEKKDIEEVLRNLIEEQKVYKKGKNYKLANKATWHSTFVEESKVVPYKVPYFNDYAVFRNGDMIVIGAKPGAGKCHSKGTKILMYDGRFKNVEDVEVGDKLMGNDSTPRNVLELCRGKETMYEVIPNKGQKFVVNESHILSVKNTSTKKITNISVKDFLNKDKTFQTRNKLYRTGVKFTEIETPVDPYFLGVWLGDGTSSAPTITTPEKEIEEYLKDYAKKLGLLCHSRSYKESCKTISIVNARGNWQNKHSLKEMLKKLNVINNKHIPDVYKYNSREKRLQLLAGLLDTDGHYSKGFYDIITKFETLRDDIEYLAKSLGYYVHTTTKKVKKYPNKIYYRLSICGNFTDLPMIVERKKPIVNLNSKDRLVTGFSLKKLNQDYYYGFTLDGNKLYVIQDFFVTHNSTLGMNIIKQLVDQDVKPYYINLESGNRFVNNAMSLGLKEGDFYWTNHYQPQNLELEDKAVTILDWLLPEDFSKVDKLFGRFSEQLDRHGGLLIVFVQLKKWKDKNGKEHYEFFAPNLLDQFPSFVCKYQHGGGTDNENTLFETSKIRESKVGLQYLTIPTFYDRKTKILELRK